MLLMRVWRGASGIESDGEEEYSSEVYDCSCSVRLVCVSVCEVSARALAKESFDHFCRSCLCFQTYA